MCSITLKIILCAYNSRLRCFYFFLLNMGLILALVQLVGNSQVARDILKISSTIGAISFLSSLSTVGLISSGPDVLSVLRFDRSFRIPFRSNVIPGIVG